MINSRSGLSLRIQKTKLSSKVTPQEIEPSEMQRIYGRKN